MKKIEIKWDTWVYLADWRTFFWYFSAAPVESTRSGSTADLERLIQLRAADGKCPVNEEAVVLCAADFHTSRD